MAKTPKESEAAKLLGRRGGFKRAARLSPEERRASAVKAIQARWAKSREKKGEAPAVRPATYLLRYEAMREADDAAIAERLKKVYPKSLIVFDSTWLLRTSQSPAQVVEMVKPYLRRTDAVLVLPVSGEGAWKGLSAGAAGWLGKYLTRTAVE